MPYSVITAHCRPVVLKWFNRLTGRCHEGPEKENNNDVFSGDKDLFDAYGDMTTISSNKLLVLQAYSHLSLFQLNCKVVNTFQCGSESCTYIYTCT